MSRDKKSFFERLTGTINMNPDEDIEIEDERPGNKNNQQQWAEETQTTGELAVDVYQTPDNIFVKTMVAGVKPEDLDVSITRDMVTISGKREEARTVSDEDFLLKELYWGQFSRSILLPAEVDVEGAEAMEKHGLLIIRLPKVDKGRQTKLRIKTT